MAQYYHIIQNLDEIKHLNLENCVIMNEDGTQFSPRSVNMTHEKTMDLCNLYAAIQYDKCVMMFVFMSTKTKKKKNIFFPGSTALGSKPGH